MSSPGGGPKAKGLRPPIVLASISPRRAQLLERIGLEFTVVPSGVPEHLPGPGHDADASAIALAHARAKAAEVAGRTSKGLVIGADTVVVLEGDILGKPRDALEAVSMLTRLSGRRHDVITAVAIEEAPSGTRREAFETTAVWFRKLARDEIEAYVATGEPMDKAGAYGVQELGSVLVERIEGDYFNVVGLPLALLTTMLAGFGIHVLGLR